MSEQIGEIIFSKNEIEACINQLSIKINKYYKYIKEDVLCIVVMNGAFIFASDLMRKFKFNVSTEFISLSSYKGIISQNEVECTMSFNKNIIKNRNVLIIEDIVDTGKTFSLLLNEIEEANPGDLKVCTLINRNIERKLEVKIDFIGFNLCCNSFVIGYGMDFNSKYRNLQNIHEFIL